MAGWQDGGMAEWRDGEMAVWSRQFREEIEEIILYLRTK
jgi:hypothetical protein